MSIEKIKEYNDRIESAIKSGKDNEEQIRDYFYELLKNYTMPLNIEIEKEIYIESNSKNKVKPDGRLIKEHLTVGYVENKDRKDDLYKEIDKKIKKNYPLSNIIFEDSKTIILYQDGLKTFETLYSDEEETHKLLKTFLSFKPTDLIEFEKALINLKDIIPDLAEELRVFFSSEKNSNKAFKESLIDFLESLKTTVNENIDEAQAIEIIIQHMLTEDIFVIIFSDQNFSKNNILF